MKTQNLSQSNNQTALSSTVTLGLDLGDKKHALCAINAAGDIIQERPITNSKDALARLSKKYPGATVAMEVGMQSPWISRFFKEGGHVTYVANARKLRMIYTNDRKCDELDARMLAKIGRMDPSLLYPIEHTSERAQRDLLQVKLGDNLVRQRVDIVSSVRFTLKSIGVRVKSPKTSAFAKQTRVALGEEHGELLAMIEPSLKVIDEITSQVKALDKAIEKLCDEVYPETARLRQIGGIGPITALAFVLTIETPQRFAHNRDVGAYLGLVPRRDQSGDRDKVLSISRAGNSYLRKLLVSAAQYMLGPFGEECDLRTSGLRLASRSSGTGAKKKAAVATARKLSVMMLSLWREGGEYERFRHGVEPEIECVRGKEMEAAA